MYEFGLLTQEDKQKLIQLDELLKKDSNNILILLKKGFILHSCALDDKAIEIFKKIIEIDPFCEKGYMWLLHSLWSLGDSDQLKEFSEKAINLFPQNAMFYYYLAYAIQVLNYHQLLQHTQEIFYYLKKAITLEPNIISIRIFLIECLLENKEFSLAEKEIMQTLEQIQYNFPVPEDEIDLYYEKFITRRVDIENSIEVLNTFLQKINQK